MAESLFYLYRATRFVHVYVCLFMYFILEQPFPLSLLKKIFSRDKKYRKYGERMIRDINENMRVECGFASVKSVISLTLWDHMESFMLSEV